MMQRRISLVVVAVAVLSVAACHSAYAQGQRGRGGRGGAGFGRGGDVATLAGIEAVQKEIKADADQVAAIDALREDMRGARGQRGGQQNLSREERQQLAQQREERAKAAREKIAGILKPEQMARLEQISLQVRNTQALADEDVAAKLKLSGDQKEKVAAAIQESNDKMQAQMRELFQGGDRAAMREKMAELRKEASESVLAHLTAEQKEQFEAMKGEPFEMPAGGFGRGGGGRRGQGGQGQGRPGRPE